MVQCRTGNESFAARAFQVGVSSGSGVVDALQVVMREGRTSGRHDGRDTKVRRFTPLSLRRHASSRARQHLFVRVESLLSWLFDRFYLLSSISLSLARSLSIYLSLLLSRSLQEKSNSTFFALLLQQNPQGNHHPHSRQGILGLRRSLNSLFSVFLYFFVSFSLPVRPSNTQPSFGLT